MGNLTHFILFIVLMMFMVKFAITNPHTRFNEKLSSPNHNSMRRNDGQKRSRKGSRAEKRMIRSERDREEWQQERKKEWEEARNQERGREEDLEKERIIEPGH
jgi:hypothetical protein